MSINKPEEGDIKGLKVFYKGEWIEFPMKGSIILDNNHKVIIEGRPSDVKRIIKKLGDMVIK